MTYRIKVIVNGETISDRSGCEIDLDPNARESITLQAVARHCQKNPGVEYSDGGQGTDTSPEICVTKEN